MKTVNNLNISSHEEIFLSSLISSGYYDEANNLIDNNKLNLTTNTLTFSSLGNTIYKEDTSHSIGTNIGINANTNPKPNTDNTKINQSTLSLSQGSSYSSSKVLATLGGGELTITDMINSDNLKNLNRDTQALNLELYKVDIKSSVDASLDHRLLNEDGRADIKKDIKASGLFYGTLTDILTKESQDLSSMGRNYKLFEASITFAQLNPQLQEELNNPNISPDRRALLEETKANLIFAYAGYKLVTVTGINTDEKVLGYYDPTKNNIYLNTGEILNAKDSTYVVGHEIGHALANQDNKLFNNNIVLHEEDANIVANIISSNIAFGLKNYQGMALGTQTYTNNELSQNMIDNNIMYEGLDKSEGYYADINLFNKDKESNIYWGASFNDIFSSSFVVSGHGDPGLIRTKDGKPISAEQLAELIINHPEYKQGQKVKILSCNSGTERNLSDTGIQPSLAQKVADILGVEVVGVTNGYYMYQAYIGLTNGPDKGAYLETFKPKDKE